MLISLLCWNRLHNAMEERQANINCETICHVLVLTSGGTDALLLLINKKRTAFSSAAKGVRT